MALNRQPIVFDTGDYPFNEERMIKALSYIAEAEGSRIERLFYRFVSREIIRQVNVRHLSHDYDTDVITFQYHSIKGVCGEIYISPDVVFDNARDLVVSGDEELARVIIHGLLHLLGYNDHAPHDKIEMRRKEDVYLKYLKF